MAASQTVLDVLHAAGEVFADKGFQDATVREICARAGVNLAAVNYHFGDKERLYIEAVKNARNLLEAAVPMPDLSDSVDPEDKLGLFIRTLTRRLLGRDIASWQHRLLVREFVEPSRACEEMMQESIVPRFQLLLSIVRQLLPDDVPEHTVQQVSFSIIAQVVYYRFQERVVGMLIPPGVVADHYTPDELAEHITRFSVAAIRAFDDVSISTPNS